MTVIDAIGTSLGRGLTPEHMRAVAELANVKEFMGGDTIVRQFDRNSDLAVVLEGTARVTTFNGDPIAELGPGSIVGEVSLIDEQPRSATVRAVGTTKVAIIPCGELRNLMTNEPEIDRVLLRNIATILCGKLRLASLHMDGLMATRA